MLRHAGTFYEFIVVDVHSNLWKSGCVHKLFMKAESVCAFVLVIICIIQTDRHDRQYRPNQSGLDCLVEATPILRLI
jgi:hypothetical protein